MVKLSERTNQALDDAFTALADPTRRAILARLARGDCTVGQLADPFDISLPAVSKHLRILERAGLLHQQKDGRLRRCRLDPRPLRRAYDWVAHYRRYWSKQLDSLAQFLESPQKGARP